MRETITFPRPYHRTLKSVLFVALLGALILVLAVPVSMHAGWKPSEVPTATRGTSSADTTAGDRSTAAIGPRQ